MESVARATRNADLTKYQQGTSFDRIKYHYLGKLRKEKLTATELQLIDRWENVWRLYKQHYKGSLAIKYHLEICKRQGKSISHVTAWRDLQSATKIYGKITRLDRQAKLQMLDEMATDTYILAKDQGELGEMNRAVANLIKINDQVEDYLEDSREPHKYELHIHVDGKKRTLDLNKLPVQNRAYQDVLSEVEENEEEDGSFARLIDEAEDHEA
jgi:hypothetical protein